MAERRQPREKKPSRQREGRQKDLALVFGPTADGEGFNVLRRRAGSAAIEAATVRPLREGRAITGEVVHLEQRKEAPFLFDCETDEELSTVTPASATASARDDRQFAGPPQVATDEYRRGWDAIWGSRSRPTSVN
jgi:hypothetical protein